MKRPVPEMIGVLGHELGHLYHGDTTPSFWNQREHASFGGYLAVGSSLASIAVWVLFSLLPASLGPLPYQPYSAGNLLPLVMGFATIGWLAHFGTARLRERRADLFSARLVGAEKAALHFISMLPRGTLDLRASIVAKIPALLRTHPRLETRVAYLRREAKRQAARLTR